MRQIRTFTFLSAATFLGMAAPSLGQGSGDGFTDPGRLQYHGAAFYDDVLEHKEEVRELRTYMNWIMAWSAEHTLRGRYPVSLLDLDDEKVEVIRAFLRKEGERIRFLNSLGFKIMWNLPLYELMRDSRFDEYEKQLHFIKENLPEMAMVEWVYVFDEPDLHGLPSTEDLERYIDIFKSVFPNIKTTICYAIVQPKFLEVVPPKNLDLLSVDPYFLNPYAHTAADFEQFYRERLGLALSWVTRWDKPYFIACDSLWRNAEGGKEMPSAEIALWYYQVALTQPQCIGLAWCYYGNTRIESEDLDGLAPGKHLEVEKVHREIGERILGEPTPLGLPGEIGLPPVELR